MKRIQSSLWTQIGVVVLLAVGTARMPMAKAAVDPLVVKTSAGLVRGLPREGGGARFLGIPFAQPPVGVLRWQEPLPAKAWSGVKDATRTARLVRSLTLATGTGTMRRKGRRIACI